MMQLSFFEQAPAGPRSNINPAALAEYREMYGYWVTEDDLFYGVYGILHSPDYRRRYATDLAKMLPRIPDLVEPRDFLQFAIIGRYLADLHINYERVPMWAWCVEEYDIHVTPDDPVERYRVERMKWAVDEDGNKDHTAVIVSPWLTLRGIPEAAQRYQVGPRSALNWWMYNYRVRRDKRSGIINDVNDWGLELDPPNPRYIIDLGKRLVTVSMWTMEAVDALPLLEER